MLITLPKDSVAITFDNNKLLTSLYGEDDSHLKLIEKNLNVITSSRGNVINISGQESKINQAKEILEFLYNKLEKNIQISESDITWAIKNSFEYKLQNNSQKKINSGFEEIIIKTPKKQISPFSKNQANFINLLMQKEMVFANGPAGTGKTYLAVAVAVSMFLNHKIDRIILCRPAIEAGEKIGFLPGDMKDKIDPYMQPLYDSLYEMMPSEKVDKYIENKIIEILPLAFMRGRTLKDSFIILDEAQNSTPTQMKMFLTRLGQRSRMVINGDLSQTDLPGNQKSGFDDAVNKLTNIKEIGFISFTNEDVIRHQLVAKILKSYE